MSTVNELAQRARADPAALLPLWEAVEKLISMWAYRYVRNVETRNFDVQDLHQAGYLAVVDAVNGFDPAAGMAFTSYLKFHVRRHFAIVAGVRSGKQQPENYATSLNAPLSDDSDDCPLDLLSDPDAEFADDVADQECRRQDCKAILAEADKLPEELRQALILTAWNGHTVPDAARILNTPPAQVRHNRNKALLRVRNSKAGRLLWRDYYSPGHVSLSRFMSTHMSEVEEAVIWRVERR